MRLDARVHAHCNDVVFSKLQAASQIHSKRSVPALVRRQMLSIQVYVGDRHHTLELQLDQLVFPTAVRTKMLPVPRNKSEHVRIECLGRGENVGMRYGNMLEGMIVEIASLAVFYITRRVQPAGGKSLFHAGL